MYLIDIAYVAYLWRPTANNRRFAMSDEVKYPNRCAIKVEANDVVACSRR